MNLSLRRNLSFPLTQYALYAAALAVALGLAAWLGTVGTLLNPLPERDYAVNRCPLTADAPHGELRVLDAVYVEEQGMFAAWCNNRGQPWSFAELALRSVHRDRFDLRQLYDARYDLVLAKPELLTGSGAPARVDYVQIARYPQYGSQLVSLAGTPELSRAWLQGKTLGLLDDPNSVSAYQIPRAILREQRLEDAAELVYFRTYGQLYRALFERRVDVIAAIVSDEGPDSALQLPPGLVLAEAIPGPAWYLHRDWLGGPVHCELLAALQQLGGAAGVDYLRGLQTVLPCDGGPR